MADKSLELIAPAIHCEGCAASIRRLLGKLPGVAKVDVDVLRKAVSVVYDDGVTGVSQIRERLSLAGFEAEPEVQ